MLLAKVTFPHELTKEEFELYNRGNSKMGVHVDLDRYADRFEEKYGIELGTGAQHPVSYTREKWWKTRSYMWFSSYGKPVSSTVLSEINKHMHRYYKLPIGTYGDFIQIPETSGVSNFDRKF